MMQKHINLSNSLVINTLNVNQAGNILAVGQQGDFDGFTVHANLTLLSTKNWEVVDEVEKCKDDYIYSAQFLQDDKILAYVKGLEYGEIKFYKIGEGSQITCDVVTSNIGKIASASQAPRIIVPGIMMDVWDWQKCERLWTLQDYICTGIEGRQARPAVADITPDGTQIAIVGDETDKLSIWDIENNKLLQSLDGAPLNAHAGMFSPHQEYFAVIGYLTRGTFIWNLEENKQHLPEIFNDETEGNWSLCFHPKGGYLVMGTIAGFVTVFEIKMGELIAYVKLHNGRIWDLTFTPDGEYLITGGDDGVVVVSDFEELCRDNPV